MRVIRTLYGLFIDDIFPLTTTTVFGLIMALVYIVIFLLATKDTNQAAKLCGMGAVPVVLFTVYAVLAWTGVTGQSNSSTGDVFGYISLLVSIGFYASPFATISEVLRSRSAASIPIALCTAGTVGNSFWTLYGLAQSDWFIFLPNVVCVLIGVAQILLYIKYNPNRQAPLSQQEDAVVVNVVISPSTKHSQQIDFTSPTFHVLQSPAKATA